MTALSPPLAAAVAADRVRIFGALRMDMPSATVRLLDGSAEIVVGGELYKGEDPVFGTWESVDDIEDGTGDQAPGMTITLLPSSDAATASLADPNMQGSAVRVSLGAVDESTGLSIGDAYVAFLGEVDVPVLKIGARKTSVEYDCVGGMERLFFDDEGIRLSAAWHRQVWPSEAGMDHATGITENAYWGQNPPNPGVTYQR